MKKLAVAAIALAAIITALAGQSDQRDNVASAIQTRHSMLNNI